MIYTLSLIDCLVFGVIIPQEGNYVAKLLHKDIREKVSVKMPELKTHGIELRDGESVSIKNEWGSIMTEIEFTAPEIEIICASLRQLDVSNRLNDNTVRLYEKFILNKS